MPDRASDLLVAALPPRRFRLLDVPRMSVKAGISAALAVLVADVVGSSDPLSAAFVALACVAPSAFGGLRRGFEQAAASLIGAAVAMVVVVALPGVRASALLPIAVATAIIATLVVTLRSLSDGAYYTAGFSALYVFFMPYPSGLESLRGRMAAVACGVAAASLTNTLAAALVGPTIVRRRRAIGRAAASEALRARAETFGNRLPSAEALDAHHHGLAVLAEAVFDLGDSAREAFFPGADRVRREAAAAIAEVRILDELLHVAALLSFADVATASRAPWASALDALAASLRQGVGLGAARALVEAALEHEVSLATAAQGRLLLVRIQALEACSDAIDPFT